MDAKTFRRIHLAHRRSGLSVATFCRKRRLSPHNFYYWRKKYGGGAGASDFVELHIKPGLPPPLSAGSSSAPLLLLLGPATFQLGEGFSQEALVQSLRALREAKLC